jgi:hypothetical protein
LPGIHEGPCQFYAWRLSSRAPIKFILGTLPTA